MSRDIRSFFIKKDGGSNSKPKESQGGSKKRTIRVIESDSDDDSIFDRPKEKKQKESNSAKKESPKKKPSPKKTPTSTPMSASSYFGTSPVQQKHKPKPPEKTPKPKEKEPIEVKPKTSGRSKKSKKVKENGKSNETDYTIDDDFDDDLLQISEVDLEKLVKQEDNKNASVAENKTVKSPKKEKVTPVKKEEKPGSFNRTPNSTDRKSGKGSLPDSDHKRRNIESYHKFLNRSGPKNPGSKEIPKGSPTCLRGLTFVITGVLESMEREEATSLIERCGGRVTSSISGKTNYVVVGDEPGESKLQKAEKFGTAKLSENDLLELIKSRTKGTLDLEDESSSSQDIIEGTPKKERNILNESKTKRSLESDYTDPKKQRKTIEIKAPKFETKTEETTPVNDSSGYETQTNSQASDVCTPKEFSNDVVKVGECLWVDKYKPKTTKQIIGQTGDKSNVKKLIYWLENWSKNHLNSNVKKSKPAPWQSNDGSAFKAALLSGPPGVGKTTTVHLVCKELGLDVIEFNASDTRSKKLLKEEVADLLKTKTVHGYFQGEAKRLQTNHVLVMDEVDGMGGNEDRGGMNELIQVIKTARVPVICMCNDRSHPKMRSLVNYCFDLRFNKPRVEQIKGAMMSICFKENVKIPGEALEEIIINANQDVRQIIHNLSLWAVRDKTITKEEATKNSTSAKKPLNLGPWDVARKVFSASEHSSMTLRDKEELFFQDYSLGPLFVQDTYIRVKPYKAKNDKKATLNLLSKTADALLWGDIVERTVRSDNAWSLLPVQAIFSSVLPGYHMEGQIQSQIQFPVWFGKNSKRNRFDRILQELQMHMRLSISGSKEAVNLDYLQVLRDAIVRPLLTKGADGVPETLQIMSDYNLTKEDVENVMELSLWPGRKDIFASIDPKVKAALTRAYNKEGKVVPFSTSVTVKKTKITDNEMEIDGEMGIKEEIEESDDDNVELDAMIKKGKTKSKAVAEEKGKKETKKPPKEAKKPAKEAKKERKKK